MILLLIRHAKAEDFGSSGDGSRALTAKGQLQSRQVGRFLKERDLLPDLVLHSPLVRARETAEIFCQTCGADAPVQEAWLSCGMRPEEALAELAVYNESMETVAIVGHEPDFSQLVGYLLGAERGYVQVKKASVIALSVQPPRKNGVLHFSVWPAMLPVGE